MQRGVVPFVGYHTSFLQHSDCKFTIICPLIIYHF
jgi:hypothetical protein